MRKRKQIATIIESKFSNIYIIFNHFKRLNKALKINLIKIANKTNKMRNLNIIVYAAFHQK
jgi:hypothetical protein